jgi:hypothetical protein
MYKEIGLLRTEDGRTAFTARAEAALLANRTQMAELCDCTPEKVVQLAGMAVTATAAENTYEWCGYANFAARIAIEIPLAIRKIKIKLDAFDSRSKNEKEKHFGSVGAYDEIRKFFHQFDGSLYVEGVTNEEAWMKCVDYGVTLDSLPLERRGGRASRKEQILALPEEVRWGFDMFSYRLAYLPTPSTEPKKGKEAKEGDVKRKSRSTYLDAFGAAQATLERIISPSSSPLSSGMMRAMGNFRQATKEICTMILDDEKNQEAVVGKMENLGKVLSNFERYLACLPKATEPDPSVSLRNRKIRKGKK